MSQRPILLALLLAATAPLAPAPAHAQQPPAQPGQADAHFKRGVELYKEADYAAALIEFRRAYEVDPRYQALYNIGMTHYQLQDYANALRTLEKYLKDGGAQISAERRAEVEKEIEKLKTRVAQIEITVNEPDADVAIDDVPAGKSPLTAPLLVSAGKRRVTVSKAGRPPVTQVVELAGGDLKKVTITLIAPAVTPGNPPPGGDTVAPPPKPVPVAPWIITGLLGAGAVVTGSLALVSSNDLKDKLATLGVKPDDVTSAHDKVRALSITTDVLIGATAVALGVSIYFTVSARSDNKPASPAAFKAPSFKLVAGPRSLIFTGSF